MNLCDATNKTKIKIFAYTSVFHFLQTRAQRARVAFDNQPNTDRIISSDSKPQGSVKQKCVE